MTAFLCVLASGAGFFLATGLGGTFSTGADITWVIALAAPVPVLWLAFRPAPWWLAFVAPLAAGILGGLNLLPAYVGLLPWQVLALGIVAPALAFAVSAVGARFIARRVSRLAGTIAFAVIWTSFDYLLSLGPNGAATSPAYSQIGQPYMVQSAALFGIWAVTFVMGIFAAGAAMEMATGDNPSAVLAVGLVVLNAGFGVWRTTAVEKGPVAQVGLAADDARAAAAFQASEKAALGVSLAYAEDARRLAREGATLIVLPEKIAVLEPAWRAKALAALETVARQTHTTIVAGFDDRGAVRRNIAVAFSSATMVYAKRRLVPGLEGAFVPGQSPLTLADHTGIAVCKDMDFPEMLRGDAARQPTLLAVPAWDFDRDRFWHARLAIMRGVEEGFAVVRSARGGLLTASDALGRVAAMKRSDTQGMIALVGSVARGPGTTLYARIGDIFAWVCIGFSLILIACGVRPRR